MTLVILSRTSLQYGKPCLRCGEPMEGRRGSRGDGAGREARRVSVTWACDSCGALFFYMPAPNSSGQVPYTDTRYDGLLCRACFLVNVFLCFGERVPVPWLKRARAKVGRVSL